MHGGAMRYSRVDAGSFTVDEVTLPGKVSFACDPMPRLISAVIDDGIMEITAEGTTDRTGPGGVGLLRPGVPFTASQDHTRFRAITLDPVLLHQVDGTPLGQSASLPYFDATQPVDAAAADLWRATARYAADLVATGDAVSPLALGNTCRLLAQVALTVFPNTTTAEPRLADARDGTPATVRRAVAFIEANADRDITVADIAQAAFVTPRAVQYAFRRHLDTTPLAHLRRVRLDCAHRDLLAADPATATVTEIAARWGFTHPGHFSAYYRDAYRTTPSNTLGLSSGSRPPTSA
ncbi:AraC family transcriptional regulator [Streptomyces sp. WAC07061]|nr:AraC family transcriptional regulator [Streptomyces sp. WAC07061]